MSAAVRKRGLGRGLESLLADEPVRALALDRLRPNRFQPRSEFDDEALEELARSIRTQGLVQPIVVTPGDDGVYTIIAGERRWRAAQRAGLSEVPVAVREVSGDRELLELALVENLQRADLNPIEEAEAYRTLAVRFDLQQQEIAERVGKSRPAIANTLRLLKLPEEIQHDLRAGRITAGQARPLLALEDRAVQLALAERAKEGWTARQIERAVQDGEAGTPAAPRRARRPEGERREVFAAAAEEKLTKRLQTKVEIRRAGRQGRGGGQVRIHFHSEEELIRLYDRLMERGAKR